MSVWKITLAVVVALSFSGLREVSLGHEETTGFAARRSPGFCEDENAAKRETHLAPVEDPSRSTDGHLKQLCSGEFRGPVSANGMSDSWGRDFVMAFPDNWYNVDARVILAADVQASGTVDIPGLSWSQNFTVAPHCAVQIAIPSAAEVQGSGAVSNLGIHVTTDQDVCAFFHNPAQHSSDACMALPSDVLGDEYIILGYPETASERGFDPDEGPSQFTLVSTCDDTRVTITPSATTLDGKPGGVPFDVAMNRFDTYQLQAGYQQDLSGSHVVSTEPIAVYAGSRCTDVPMGYCCADFIVEQMPPIETWGRSFLTSAFARPGSYKGDRLRVLASQDNTAVSFTPPVPGSPFILNRGELAEIDIKEPMEILADKPVLVAQYGGSNYWTKALGDPFQVLILSREQFLNGYVYLTPPAAYELDFVSIIVPTAAISSLLLDGSPVDPSIFSPIGSTGYSYGSVQVNDGCHTAVAGLPFGIYAYGWGDFDSYAYTAGMRFAALRDLVTGGGWIAEQAEGGDERKTFGFNAHSELGVVWGQLQFTDHTTGMKVHGDTVVALAVYGDTSAEFSGTCRLERMGGFTFECSVEDWGEPGRGKDRFSLNVWDPDGNLCYDASGLLGGGNIQIHTLEDGIEANPGETSEGVPEPEHNRSIQLAGATHENRFNLAQNSPNPFHRSTTMTYAIPMSSTVALEVFDITGRLVETLVNETQQPGVHQARWDRKQNPSGVYFYCLRAGEFLETRKMVVVE